MEYEAHRSRSGRVWQAIPFLLGAEAALLLVWHLSGFQYPTVSSDIGDLASILLGTAPFLTILVGLGLGWIGRQPRTTSALLGLTLVAPVLILVHLTVSPHFLQGPGGLLVTPACAAAAAGLVAGLQGRPGRGYVLLVLGCFIGFQALALPMWALAIGNVAECPTGCNSLEMRGIAGAAIVVGIIGLVAMTPGFAIGSLVGRRCVTSPPR